jgi:hypothetical protein
MFGIGKLWTAIANLAAHVEALGATVAEINTGVRAHLHLDAPLPAPPALVEVTAPEEEEAATPRRRKVSA